VDLTWTDAEQAFRTEARTWLTEHLAAWHRSHGGEDRIASSFSTRTDSSMICSFDAPSGSLPGTTTM
jgi:hypothetical protein